MSTDQEQYLYADYEVTRWGIDEVGVSAAAGPLIVVAYRSLSDTPVNGVRDCKALSQNVRERLASLLVQNGYYYTVVVPAETIDSNGLRRSILDSYKLLTARINSHGGEDIVIDGVADIVLPGVRFVIGADALFYQVAAASIIAKVMREKIMSRLEELFPNYTFSKHRGYLTKDHKTQLLTHGGIFPPHRKLMLRNLLNTDPNHDLGTGAECYPFQTSTYGIEKESAPYWWLDGPHRDWCRIWYWTNLNGGVREWLM